MFFSPLLPWTSEALLSKFLVPFSGKGKGKEERAPENSLVSFLRKGGGKSGEIESFPPWILIFQNDHYLRVLEYWSKTKKHTLSSPT